MDWPSPRTTCHGNALHICWQCTQVFQAGRCCKVKCLSLCTYWNIDIISFFLWFDPEVAHLAVLMVLGSKLPWESTDACFSSVPSRLTSTKSGGRAPAMADRHDLAILKSSASYFCRRDGGRRKMKRGRGLQSGFFGGGKTEDGDMKDRESGKVPSDEPINDSSVTASPAREHFIGPSLRYLGLARRDPLRGSLAPPPRRRTQDFGSQAD